MLSESESLKVLKDKVRQMPELLVTLGSGWNEVLKDVKVEVEVGYKELFGVGSGVPGHEGKLVVANVQIPNSKSQTKRVAFMAGRLHLYEGYTAREGTLPIRVFAEAGMKKIVLTSAAGALNEKFSVGDFVILSDLMTLFLSPDNPLLGADFVDMSQVFEPKMRGLAKEVCVRERIGFHDGVYVYYHGPNFETPVDKMALRQLGADVVGMSTVPEAIMARSLGVEVLGISFVTNLAFVKHDHKDVLAAANKASGEMVKLLTGVIEGL